MKSVAAGAPNTVSRDRGRPQTPRRLNPTGLGVHGAGVIVDIVNNTPVLEWQ